MKFVALATLALRRTLGWRLLFTLVVLWFLAWRHAPSQAPYLGFVLEDAAELRMRTRHAVWSLSLLLLAPMLVLHAASITREWWRKERFWLGARPLSARTSQLAKLSGIWLAGGLLLSLTALSAELAAGSGEPGLRLLGRLEHPTLELLGPTTEVRLPLSDALRAVDAEARPGAQLALRLTALPDADPRATAELAILPASSALRLSMADRNAHRLAVPDGRAPELWIRREAGAAFLVGHDSIELLVRATSERLASLSLLAGSLLAWTAWCIAAALAGTWLRPSIAALTCLALFWLPHAFPIESRAVPGGALPQALVTLERGLVPAPTAPGELAWAAVALVAGVAFLGRSRRGLTP